MLLMQTINMQKKDFKIKHLDEYDDLYVQSNTLLLAGVFNTF